MPFPNLPVLFYICIHSCSKIIFHVLLTTFLFPPSYFCQVYKLLLRTWTSCNAPGSTWQHDKQSGQVTPSFLQKCKYPSYILAVLMLFTKSLTLLALGFRWTEAFPSDGVFCILCLCGCCSYTSPRPTAESAVPVPLDALAGECSFGILFLPSLILCQFAKCTLHPFSIHK